MTLLVNSNRGGVAAWRDTGSNLFQGTTAGEGGPPAPVKAIHELVSEIKPPT